MLTRGGRKRWTAEQARRLPAMSLGHKRWLNRLRLTFMQVFYPTIRHLRALESCFSVCFQSSPIFWQWIVIWKHGWSLQLCTQLTQLRLNLKPEKKIRSERDSIPWLCDTVAVLYQLSYQANWELHGHVKVKLHILELRRMLWRHDWSVVKLKPEKNSGLDLGCRRWRTQVNNCSSCVLNCDDSSLIPFSAAYIHLHSSSSTGILWTHTVASSQLAWSLSW